MKYIKSFENVDQQKILNKELIKFSGKNTSLQKMRELIESGADVNYNDINDGTPLMVATKKMFYNGMKLLIQHGADVNAKNRRNDETALLYISMLPAYTLSKYESTIIRMINLLIEDTDLNAKTKGGWDVFDHFNIISPKIVKYIQDKFPEQYEKYLINKSTEKYNI